MTVVWILLAVVSGFLGLNAISAVLTAPKSPDGTVSTGRVVGPVLLAIAAVAGLFGHSYGQQRTWMLVGSFVVLGLILLCALSVRLSSPPPRDLDSDELAERIGEYASRAGAHAVSLLVVRDLLTVMLHGRVARYRLTDRPCLFCFVEQRLTALLADGGREPTGAPGLPDDEQTVIAGYRDRLRRGPSVEVHIRRPGTGEPWHIEFAMPSAQPVWDSNFLATACVEHRATAGLA